jgi:hypothetical protein
MASSYRLSEVCGGFCMSADPKVVRDLAMDIGFSHGECQWVSRTCAIRLSELFTAL